MEYKKVYKIKPEQVLPDGRVLFTNGTNTVIPNQVSCEAYGYKYNSKDGTCTAFHRPTKLIRLT